MRSQNSFRRLLLAAAAPLALACLTGPTLAEAQAIERNLPPAPKPEAPAVLAPNATPSSQDDNPIGPNITGLMILGPEDVARVDPVTGLNTALVARLNTQAARTMLQPFIGQPLSRKRIAEIEATIARFYRHAGFPFVSLSTPPQSIGGGMLQIRVVEFHDGAVSVKGAKDKQAKHVRDQVRLQPGQPIDAPLLSDDLDWINRYPFHHVEAVFSPGDALGRSDLTLQDKEYKPWQVYAGYANSGSASTTWDRYLLGGQIGGLLIPGSLLSYQLTASPDFFNDHGDAFGDSRHPAYLSHGLRALVPIAPRQDIEASFDRVETNQSADPFKVRQITDELTLDYRTSLSNFSDLPGDLALGIEAKHEQHETFFAGTNVLDGAIEVYQLHADWTYAWSDPSAKSSLELTAHDSPGRMNRRDDAGAYSVFSNGRIAASDYQYFGAQYVRDTRLPGRWSLSTVLIAQYAWGALPDTEQMGVGGVDLVRGYTLDDGAYDRGLVSRNELRSPAFQLPINLANIGNQVSPFGFVDVGYGATEGALHRTADPASVGAGADIQIGPAFSLNLTGAYAIRKAIATKAGDALLEVRATVAF
jgi:hemolysin activation/secretion protein